MKSDPDSSQVRLNSRQSFVALEVQEVAASGMKPHKIYLRMSCAVVLQGEHSFSTSEFEPVGNADDPSLQE